MTTAHEVRPAAALGAGSRIAVVAGSGSLPANVVTALERQGHRPFVLMIEGEADRTDVFHRFEHTVVPIEHIEPGFAAMQARGITHVVFAGGIARRPLLRRIRVTWRFVVNLPTVLSALGSGDDKALRAVVGYAERLGITVVGAHEVVPDLLARRGAVTRKKPAARDRRDIEAAFEAARAIGRLDIGQAAVAIGGRAVALEGVEGTDGLLARVPELRKSGRLAGKTGGVLVKCTKPGQELRTDLPAIGMRTVEDAHAAGLRGIALESGRSFVLDYDASIDAADRLGLFIVGLSEEGAP